ncbi:DUF4360 domain-containing protein [Actinomadura macra]|uniref:DUF4360 domain-containing protein n=1 Tax=Actinomadura macra TaxID=46164 RepID=UPI000832AF5A|nr:DUF4360 domain-containing protein [Actinomadura macra]
MNIRRTVISALSAAGVLITLNSPAVSAEVRPPSLPPPGSVVVTLLNINGSGCRPGTVRVANEVETIDMSYSEHMAQTGGDSRPPDYRKRCAVTLDVTAPPEFTYAIVEASYNGYASLRPGASAHLKARFRYSQSTIRSGQHQLAGPFSGDWMFVDEDDVSQTIFKPCDEKNEVALDTELQVNLDTSDETKISFISLDPFNIKPHNFYKLAWKRCSTA